MKPRSIVGPIILIGFGVLFLVNNLQPELPWLSFFGTYWPFLLIAWGLLRLIEILTWHSQGKPLPRAGIGGGEWALAIILTVGGSAFLFGSRNMSRWTGRGLTFRGLDVIGEPFDYPLAANKTATSIAPKIVLENFRGNARITGSATNEIRLTGSKTIRAFNRSEADKSDKVTPLEIVEQGGQIIIRMNHDRVADSTQVKAVLEITIPKGASVEARGRYGDFDVNDLDGGVEIISDNAGVRLSNIGGPVRIDLRRSDMIRVLNSKGPVEIKSSRGNDLELENLANTVSVNGNFTGDMQFRVIEKTFKFESDRTKFRVERILGNVRISSGNINGTNLQGPITLTSTSKDVELIDFTNSLELSVDRGDLDLRPGKTQLGKIDAKTRSGQAGITLPPNAKFELNATTDHGEANNSWGAPFKQSSEKRNAYITGSTGPGPMVTIHTNRGNVTVQKAIGGELSTSSNQPEPPRIPKPPAPPQPLKVVEQ